MPLSVRFTKFEQAHDGYCTDNEEFESRIVTYTKDIHVITTEELEKLGIKDSEEIDLENDIIRFNYDEIVRNLIKCDYGTGYCGAKNVLIDILEIRAIYYVYEEVFWYNKNEDKLINSSYKSDYTKKSNKIRFG